MRIVIHQPYFLPWLGYFSKLAFADAFVVLDDVGFRKRHFIDRVQIVNMHGNVDWLSLKTGDTLGRRCDEVRLSSASSARGMVTTLRESYARAESAREEMPVLEEIVSGAMGCSDRVVDINLDIICRLMNHTGMKATPFAMSSSLGLGPDCDPTSRLIEICRWRAADELLIGAGSSERVHDWRRVRDAGVSVVRQDYMRLHPSYRQTRRRRLPFERGLSIADALLNAGRYRVLQFVSAPELAPTSCESAPGA